MGAATVTGFLLLPGAGFRGWLWEPLVPCLKMPSATIETRVGDDSPEARKAATLDTVVEWTRRTLDATGWDRCIVVGHSGAGLIAARLGLSDPRVAHLVFVAANLPPQGTTALDAFPEAVRVRQREALVRQAEQPAVPLTALGSTIVGFFANTCNEVQREWLLGHAFVPEPPCLATTPMDWPGSRRPPMTYLVCTDDKTLTRDQQVAQASTFGITDVVALDSDHLPMVSAPQPLADTLNRIADGL